MVSPLTAGRPSHENSRHAVLAPTGCPLGGNPSPCRGDFFTRKCPAAPTFLLPPCDTMLGLSAGVSSQENAISTHTNVRTATAVYPMEPRSNELPPRDAPGMRAPYPSVPNPPRLVPQQLKGYQNPLKAVIPLPTSIKFLTYPLAKQPPTSHILRRLSQGYDVLFLQELHGKPLVPHSLSMGANGAVLIAIVPKSREHGACFIFSPRLRAFLEPLPHPNNGGLIAAALLHLPGNQSVLVASVCAPYES